MLYTHDSLRANVSLIPLRFAPGIVPNSLWLLDNSTYASNRTTFVFSLSHYDLPISMSQMPFRVHCVFEIGVSLPPALRSGIIRLTNSNTLRFWNLSLIKKSPHLEESLPDGGATVQRIFVSDDFIDVFSKYVKIIFKRSLY